MRIAIVDDIAAEREGLRLRLGAQLARLSLSAEIEDFASCASFLSAAEKARFDLAFLDIYMDGESGMDAARALRRFDPSCLLVFTTTSPDHALEGFRVRALHYLVKPYSDAELSSLFDEIAQRLPAPDKYIEVSAVGGAVRLRLSEIMYAEHYRHQIYIHTADGRQTVIRQTFHAFAEALPGECFFLCNRGVLVNLAYAVDFDGADFLLRDGVRLPVSRDLAKAARLAFGDYLFKRGRNCERFSPPRVRAFGLSARPAPCLSPDEAASAPASGPVCPGGRRVRRSAGCRGRRAVRFPCGSAVVGAHGVRCRLVPPLCPYPARHALEICQRVSRRVRCFQLSVQCCLGARPDSPPRPALSRPFPARRGEGVGIQSVRRIADKNGGYSRFSHDGGVFRADVLLRANPGV